MDNINILILELYKKNYLTFKKKYNGSFININFNYLITNNTIVNKIIEQIYLKIKYIDFSLIISTTSPTIVFSSILSNKYNYKHVLIKKSKSDLNYLNYEIPVNGLLLIDNIKDENTINNYIKQLNRYNIIVSDIFAISYSNNIQLSPKLNVEYLFNDYEVFSLLKNSNIISINTFNQLIKSYYPKIDYKYGFYKYDTKYKSTSIPIIQKLYKLMLQKKTNISLNFEGLEIKNIIEILGKIAKDICMIELDSKIITSNMIINSLNKLTNELNFIIILKNNYVTKLNNSITIINYHDLDLSKINKPSILYYNNNVKNSIIKSQVDDLFIIDLKTINNKNIVGFKTSKTLIFNKETFNLSNTPISFSEKHNINYNTINKLINTNKYDIINVKLKEYNNVEEEINILKIIGWTSYMDKK